jgi:hypothetical protein
VQSLGSFQEKYGMEEQKTSQCGIEYSKKKTLEILHSFRR